MLSGSMPSTGSPRARMAAMSLSAWGCPSLSSREPWSKAAASCGSLTLLASAMPSSRDDRANMRRTPPCHGPARVSAPPGTGSSPFTARQAASHASSMSASENGGPSWIARR
eukprot:2017529-Prymnesium_polylepis.2